MEIRIIERKAQSIGMGQSLLLGQHFKSGTLLWCLQLQFTSNRIFLTSKPYPKKLSIRPFNDKAANHFGRIKSELKKRGEILSDADIMIVSIAFANNFTLVDEQPEALCKNSQPRS